MTPELALALETLKRERIAEGTNLNRHAPNVAKAIDDVLRVAKAATR